MKILFDTFERKPDTPASTETSMTETDKRETSNLKNYHPIEANSRKKTKRPLGVVVSFVETGIGYELLTAIPTFNAHCLQ